MFLGEDMGQFGASPGIRTGQRDTSCGSLVSHSSADRLMWSFSVHHLGEMNRGGLAYVLTFHNEELLDSWNKKSFSPA